VLFLAMPDDADENIRVLSRFRPLTAREKAHEGSTPAVQFGADGRSVTVGADGARFAVDAVLAPDTTQEQVYSQVSSLVDAVLQGYNGTLLAYGQTGSGKTHTITGALGDEDAEGVLPRAVRHIFEGIASNADSGSEFAVSCSYLEIYKEVVRDLLQPADGSAKPSGLPIRENADKGVYVENLTEVFVMGEQEVLEIVACGNASRAVASTLMNAQSSRSHALLTLTVQQKLADGSVKVSKLNIAGARAARAVQPLSRRPHRTSHRTAADLAGSEKVSKTGSSGETLEEAKKINMSLSALCLVISALADARPGKHVPYRNSKLTRILQESLGGNSKTTLLVACAPADRTSIHRPAPPASATHRAPSLVGWQVLARGRECARVAVVAALRDAREEDEERGGGQLCQVVRPAADREREPAQEAAGAWCAG
jgi:kinesin family protein 5